MVQILTLFLICPMSIKSSTFTQSTIFDPQFTKKKYECALLPSFCGEKKGNSFNRKTNLGAFSFCYSLFTYNIGAWCSFYVKGVTLTSSFLEPSYRDPRKNVRHYLGIPGLLITPFDQNRRFRPFVLKRQHIHREKFEQKVKTSSPPFSNAELLISNKL